MYTVKRFEKGDTIKKVELASGTVYSVASGTTYGVIDESGAVMVSRNPITGKTSLEVYGRKYAAQQVADWYNK